MRAVLPVVLVAALLGCGGGASPAMMEMDEKTVAMPDAEMAGRLEALGYAADDAPSPAAPAASVATGGARARRDEGQVGKKEARNVAKAEEEAEPAPEEPADGGEPRTRSWFPEAFLWRPLLETGDDGVVTLDLTVPDQLTTWRVLALAADAGGQQTGAVHTFDTTMPVYVDPVVPGWLYAGDRIALPVQAVNTTDTPLTAQLSLTASGALDGSGVASLTLSAGGSDVRALPLRASGAGEATLAAKLSAGDRSDAAERTFPVLPTGRPVERTRGGTLTDTRTLLLQGPPTADPSTEQLEVVVFAGPLAVLQAEIARVSSGVRPEDGAYGFALAGWLERLSAGAGVEVDPALARKLRVLAWQRVVRELRAPEPSQAADLLTSMRDPGTHEQAVGAHPVLVRAVTQGQRADGTWARRPTSTLQEIVVNTAAVGRSLPEDEAASRLRASSALERFLHEVKDPYTAAVVVASGLLEGDAADPLRKLVADAVTEDAEGVPSVATPGAVVNPWGVYPTQAELLAWTVLALPADHPARGDLAAQLVQRWDGRWGFGAGRADAIALEAVVSALPGASSPVEVTLTVGDAVATGRVDPSQPRLPVVLTVRPRGAQLPAVLKAEPPVPGLAFVATRRSWVPWTNDDRLAGVDVTVEAGPLAVGVEGAVTLELVAPSGTSLHVEQGLPAGAVVAPDLAQRLPRLTNVHVLQDRVVFDTPAFGAGEILEIILPVTPAFAGTFATAPLLVGSGGQRVPMAPLVWTVVAAPGGA